MNIRSFTILVMIISARLNVFVECIIHFSELEDFFFIFFFFFSINATQS